MATKKNLISLFAGSVTGIMTGMYLNQREKNNITSKNLSVGKGRKNTSSSDEFHYFI